MTAQTTAETGLQVKSQVALQEAFRNTSAEILPIAPQVSLGVTVAFYPQTTSRNAPGFAVRFAAQVVSRTTFRTTLGTVPGTTPTVVPEFT